MTRTGHGQVLIPEFCDIHPLGSNVWREIQLFPFAFERVAALIKSKQLLDAMSSEVNGRDEISNASKPLDMKGLLSPDRVGSWPTPEQVWSLAQNLASLKTLKNIWMVNKNFWLFLRKTTKSSVKWFLPLESFKNCNRVNIPALCLSFLWLTLPMAPEKRST